jgi:hypothetical protein
MIKGKLVKGRGLEFGRIQEANEYVFSIVAILDFRVTKPPLSGSKMVKRSECPTH